MCVCSSVRAMGKTTPSYQHEIRGGGTGREIEEESRKESGRERETERERESRGREESKKLQRPFLKDPFDQSLFESEWDQTLAWQIQDGSSILGALNNISLHMSQLFILIDVLNSAFKLY